MTVVEGRKDNQICMKRRAQSAGGRPGEAALLSVIGVLLEAVEATHACELDLCVAHGHV